MQPAALYHATTKTFREGQLLANPYAAKYYPSVLAAIEKERPDSAPSRLACFCASEVPALSVEHVRATFGGLFSDLSSAPVNLYEVDIPNGWRSPVILVSTIQKALDQGRDPSPMVREYWRRERAWEYFEIFGATMKVLKAVALPSAADISIVNIRYGIGELGKATAFLGELKKLGP